MFLIYIGNAVLYVIKSPLDQIKQFKDIFSVISRRLRALLYFFISFIILPHITETFFYIRLIDIEIV